MTPDWVIQQQAEDQKCWILHSVSRPQCDLCRARVRKADAAVKVVKGGGEREQARLLHEIKVLEQCKSPHIVQFYGYV